MDRRNFNLEASGSLTPDLEGTPHSGAHQRRPAKPPQNLPGHAEGKKSAKRIKGGGDYGETAGS